MTTYIQAPFSPWLVVSLTGAHAGWKTSLLGGRSVAPTPLLDT